jgi:hypothetical protein
MVSMSIEAGRHPIDTPGDGSTLQRALWAVADSSASP